MHVKLRQVGNSLGVTLPASALKMFDITAGDIIEIDIIKVILKPRDGWQPKNSWQGSELEPLHLDDLNETSFDQNEWQW